MSNDKVKFFYCYSLRLFKFLRHEKNIKFICTGVHDKTGKKFWQFEGDLQLNAALEEYKATMTLEDKKWEKPII